MVLQITPWECTALRLLAHGSTPGELARRLGISEDEIETQLTALFARMGAAGRSEAVAAAFRRGLVISGDQLHE